MRGEAWRGGLLLLAVVALAVCADNESPKSYCDEVANAGRCHLDDGTRGGRYCPPGGDPGPCFAISACNPLLQDCTQGAGYGCFQTLDGTYCAPFDEYPCPPGASALFDLDGNVVCHEYCDFATFPELRDPDHCGPLEFCSANRSDGVPASVGLCTEGG